tara:strand:+ start:6316 stop:6543 length:228 start_codon:yes stop_codon:yes gene_type:complete
MVDLDTNKPFKGFIDGWILLSDGRIVGWSYINEKRQLWDSIRTSPIVAGLLTENGAVETQNSIYILGSPDKGEEE